MEPNIIYARAAGALFLAYFITFILADIGTRSIGAGDPVEVVNRIMALGFRLRVSFVLEVVAAVLFFLTAWALYGLLKPVNENLAVLLMLLNLGGAAVHVCALLCEFAIPMIMDSGSFQGFSAEQRQSLAVLFLRIYQNGFTLVQIFYGLWLFPLGWLVLKSGFLPTILGILLLADGAAITLWFFQYFLLPRYYKLMYPGFVISFIAEFGLALWLFIKGVKG